MCESLCRAPRGRFPSAASAIGVCFLGLKRPILITTGGARKSCK